MTAMRLTVICLSLVLSSCASKRPITAVQACEAIAGKLGAGFTCVAMTISAFLRDLEATEVAELLQARPDGEPKSVAALVFYADAATLNARTAASGKVLTVVNERALVVLRTDPGDLSDENLRRARQLIEGWKPP